MLRRVEEMRRERWRVGRWVRVEMVDGELDGGRADGLMVLSEILTVAIKG